MGAEQRGLNGSTLKMIAILTMLIDHIGAVVLIRLLRGVEIEDARRVQGIYMGMRMIGRIAFPIFCFLLIEGFTHTRNKKKYAMRLGMFALLSEIPFDLALSSQILEIGYQNIFFTLFIGLLTIMAVDMLNVQEIQHGFLRTFLLLVIVLTGMGAATILRTDYGGLGVMCILVLYFFRERRKWQITAGVLAFGWWEFPAVAAFIPIAYYNGSRGWNLKYFFYLFYPLHLLLLYMVCYLMGIADISAV